ncbi:MAG: tetratricopeptide repeat protein, partial [Candidatus Thorarchaeota archaeon]|nr:tetratricopeptide repeat protein [Candidatus Thorarchaeota archaeon]
FLDAVSIDSDFARAVVNTWRGWHLSLLNRIPESEEALHSALETFKTVTGISETERDRFLAIALTNSGVLKTNLGRYNESEDMLLEALELSQKVVANPPESMTPGRELLEVAGSLQQLGNLMRSKGDYQRAQEYYGSCLEKVENWANIENQMSQDEINRQIAFVLWHVGWLSIATNQLSEAEKYSQRGLEIADISISVYNHLCILKWSLLLKGHLKEARELNERETELSSKMTASSTELPIYLGSLSDLFSIQYLSGEYGQAIQTIERLLPMHRDYVEKAPEVYVPEYIEYHRCHGNVLKKIGNLDKARTTYQNGITLARDYIQKTEHVNDRIIIRILNDYGVFLHKMGESIEAEKCLVETIDICRRSLSVTYESLNNTRRLSTCLCNLGALLLETDRVEEAGEILKESLDLRLKIQNEAPEVFYYHSYIASSMNNLAVFYGRTSSYEESEEHLNKAIDMRLKHRTEETSEVFDPGLVAVLSNMGILKIQSGDVNESKDAFNKSIATARKLYKRNPETHRQALIKVLSNFHNILVEDDDSDSDLYKEISAELQQLGTTGIPSQLSWFVETSELF